MKLNRANAFVYRQGILPLVCMSLYLFTVFSTGYGLQFAYACQCSGRPPQDYDMISDAIFIGRVVERNYNVPFEWAAHATFDVSKSWKGIDTKLVTVHIDDLQCQTSLIQGNEYLVYAYKDSFEVRMPTCSGSTWTENQNLIEDEIAYLDSKYEPIRIVGGHTGKENFLSIIQILGAFCGIAAVAYIMLIRHR